ncbi:MAG: PAS domain S-box protein, partial [Chitinophagales bacterium]|nr:PAS domain S-box protein [Chitinophagales bacterium]
MHICGCTGGEYNFREVEDNELILKLQELLAYDFAHRKSIETELYKSEEKYRLLLEQLTDAIYLTSTDGRFLEFNKATSILLGYSDEELRHLAVQEIYVNRQDRETFTQVLHAHKEIQDYEIQLKKKNGDLIDCLVTSSIRKSRDGDVIAYQGIIRDITFRKRAEILQREKELSDKANKFKAEFLANMSHEIRTP